jgi:hypothetical protein
MKAKSILFAAVLLITASFTASAQQGEQSRINIVPTHEAGIIRIVYALEIDEPLQIRFYSRNGQIGVDKITDSYQKGITKRYDIRKIDSRNFWIEFTTPKMTLTYNIVPTKDKTNFTARLERTVYNHELVASNEK